MLALLIISATFAQSFIATESADFSSDFVVVDDEIGILPEDLLVSPWVEIEEGEVRASPGGVFEWMTSGWAIYGYEQSIEAWLDGDWGMSWAMGTTEPVQELRLVTEDLYCNDGNFAAIEAFPEVEEVFSVIWKTDGSWESAPQSVLLRYFDRGSGLIDCTGAPWSYGTEIRVRVTWLEEA